MCVRERGTVTVRDGERERDRHTYRQTDTMRDRERNIMGGRK